MVGVGQYVIFSDFGVGQCYCAVYCIFIGNYFCFIAVVNICMVGSDNWNVIVFQCFQQCGVNWGVKFLCWLQFGEFQIVGCCFCYWGEEFFFKEMCYVECFYFLFYLIYIWSWVVGYYGM